MNILKKISKWYRKNFWSLDKQARFDGVTIGKNNFIASHFWSTEGYLITVGSNCALTKGTHIFTHGGARVVRHLIPDFDTFGKVTLGDFVYVGTNSMIMPGVTVGNHVLIAAGSVVTKSVPSDVVIAGNPAKIVCSIDDYLKNNEKYNLGTKGMPAAEKEKLLKSLPDDKFIAKPFLVKK